MFRALLEFGWKTTLPAQHRPGDRALRWCRESISYGCPYPLPQSARCSRKKFHQLTRRLEVTGSTAKESGDREGPIVKIQLSLHQMAVFARNARDRFISFLTACALTSLFAPTTSFDHGFAVPATKRTRRCPLNARPRNPGFKPRQGYLWFPTGSSCSRCCQCTPHYDKGMLSFLF